MTGPIIPTASFSHAVLHGIHAAIAIVITRGVGKLKVKTYMNRLQTRVNSNSVVYEKSLQLVHDISICELILCCNPCQSSVSKTNEAGALKSLYCGFKQNKTRITILPCHILATNYRRCRFEFPALHKAHLSPAALLKMNTHKKFSQF